MVERLASFEKRLELSTFGDKRFNEVFAEVRIISPGSMFY
jgi:hypothetical protein